MNVILVLPKRFGMTEFADRRMNDINAGRTVANSAFMHVRSSKTLLWSDAWDGHYFTKTNQYYCKSAKNYTAKTIQLTNNKHRMRMRETAIQSRKVQTKKKKCIIVWKVSVRENCTHETHTHPYAYKIYSELIHVNGENVDYSPCIHTASGLSFAMSETLKYDSIALWNTQIYDINARPLYVIWWPLVCGFPIILAASVAVDIVVSLTLPPFAFARLLLLLMLLMLLLLLLL